MQGMPFEFDRALVLTITALLSEDEDFKEALEDPPGRPPSHLRMPLALVLRKIISSRQSAYKTTIAEDAALLGDATVQGRRRMAIEVRLGEKEILALASDEIEKRIVKYQSTIGEEQDVSQFKRRRF